MKKNFAIGSGGDEKLTEKELKFSYWFITHKPFLKKILIGGLISVGAIFWVYSLYYWVDYGFLSGPKERANLATMAKSRLEPEAREKLKALPIHLGEAQTFTSGAGQYDFLAEINNPNEKWRAEFEFRFGGEGLDGIWQKGFVLPKERKYLTALGTELTFRPRNARIEIKNFKYRRVNPHQISNYEKWQSERKNFVLSGENFNPRAIQDNKNIAGLTFQVKNDTAYSFWAVGFFAYLFRGEQLVAINFLKTAEFMSGETKILQMNFYEGLPMITKFEIYPELNIFDEEVYIGQK